MRVTWSSSKLPPPSRLDELLPAELQSCPAQPNGDQPNGDQPTVSEARFLSEIDAVPWCQGFVGVVMQHDRG